MNHQAMLATTYSREFSTAHLYHQPSWSEEKNRAEFGACFSQYGHGHNYRLEVFYKIPDATTASIALASREIQSQTDQVLKLYDHRHLNFDDARFKNLIPTTENILVSVADELGFLSAPASTLSYTIIGLTLFETSEIAAEIGVTPKQLRTRRQARTNSVSHRTLFASPSEMKPLAQELKLEADLVSLLQTIREPIASPEALAWKMYETCLFQKDIMFQNGAGRFFYAGLV